MKKTAILPPLSTAVTYILLTLAERDLHGYGIMLETVKLSGGNYKIGPGTLYDNLRILIAAGLVTEGEVGGANEDGRRLYQLTKAGAVVLADELARMNAVVKAGRSRLGRSKPQEAQ